MSNFGRVSLNTLLSRSREEKNPIIFDLNNWKLNSLKPPSGRSFSAPQLLQKISKEDNWPPIQNEIQRKLKNDPSWKEWRSKAPKMKQVPAFNEYRGTHAAKEFNSKDYSSEKISQLSKEINFSNLIIPKGQILFRGCGYVVENGKPNFEFRNFLSCTLCPVVAALHSQETTKEHGVLVITLRKPTRALINVGKKLSHEFEVLFDFTNSKSLSVQKELLGGEFNVFEVLF